MKCFLCFFYILLISTLFSEDDFIVEPNPLEDPSFSLATLEGEPSGLIHECVNVINGEYTDFQTDMVLPGIEPLTLQRFYSSFDKNLEEPMQALKSNHDLYLHYNSDVDWDKKQRIFFNNAFGASLVFKNVIPTKTKKRLVSKELFYKHVSNYSARMKGGRAHLKHTSVHPQENKMLQIRTGEGLTYTFDKYHSWPHKSLVKCIRKLNGNGLYYVNKDEKIRKVISFNSKNQPLDAFTFKIDKHDHHATIVVQASNQRETTYELRKAKYHDESKFYKDTGWALTRVIRPDNLPESYDYSYTPHRYPKLRRKMQPGGRFLAIDYYQRGKNEVWPGHIETENVEGYRINRVMRLKAPSGTDETEIPIYRFMYYFQRAKEDEDTISQWGHTDAYDAYDHLKTYYFNKDQRLTEIISFTGTTSPRTPVSTEKLYWGPSGTEDAGNLQARVLFSEKNTPLFCRAYSYADDDSGNICAEYLCGCLTGCQTTAPLVVDENGKPVDNGCDRLHTGYLYTKDDRNLIHYENSKTHPHDVMYEYVEGTDQISARYTISEGIKLREFFEYDEYGAVKTHIRDNGTIEGKENLTDVTERHVTRTINRKTFPAGLPETIEEKYWDRDTHQEILLGLRKNSYNKQGKLEAQEVYDSTGQLAYILKWSYNGMGQVVEEIDALGHIILRDYKDGNLISVKGPRSDREDHFEYDRMNRLIREEIKGPDEILSKTYRYDLMGNCIESTDTYGRLTQYEHDDFGRVKKVISPQVLDKNGQQDHPVVYKDYDILGNLISLTDANGCVTSANYTLYGKPYEITYPDDSKEYFEYSLQGHLKKAVGRNGTYTLYDYDYLSRPTLKQAFSAQGVLLSTESHIYDAFHLKSETDALGQTTHYTYDKAGRLIRKEQGDRKTEYAYDFLGRQSEKKEYYGFGDHEFIETLNQYNLLNQVTKEIIQDGFGKTESKIKYDYDEVGNCIAKTVFNENEIITETTRYNFLNEPVEIADGLNHKTHIEYNYSGNTRIVKKTDPEGFIEVTFYDALGRVVQLEHVNPWNRVTKKSEYRYDLEGNKCAHIETVITPDQPERQVLTQWEYDSMNRVKWILEAAQTPEQKSTHYFYNAYGELKTLQKNDGCELHHTYDAMGRLATFQSDDFHYVYHYDAASRPLRIDDLLTSRSTEKIYEEGRMVSETLANGLHVHYIYDRLDRPLKLTFPDKSEVHYEYRGSRLRKITRWNATEQYGHTYEKYDERGNLIQSKLIADAGLVTYDYDPLKRMTSIQSTHWNEKIKKRDKVGNLLSRIIQDPLGSHHDTYDYDDLNQLTKENGHLYVHDSLYNQVSKDGRPYHHNALNQILKYAEYEYKYDLKGNRISKTKADQAVYYDYDALDRLIAITEGNYQTRYAYDGFNRRLSKTHYEKIDGTWQNEVTENYLYLSNSEVGACDATGHFFEFRILGRGSGAEFGAAVALEIQGNLYAPIHDHHGHVTCLLDTQGNVVETYHYEAFGEEQIFNAHKELADPVNPWRYCGKRKDPETGFLYFGFRYYDPQTAKWICPDPLGYEAGPNLYAYVLNNPFAYQDLAGFFDLPYWTNTLHTALAPPITNTNRAFCEGLYFESKAKMFPIGHNEARFDSEFNNSIFNSRSSYTMTAGNFKLEDKNITGINGIRTSEFRGQNIANTLSEWAEGHQVKFVYNPSINAGIDMRRYFLCRDYHYMSNAAIELQRVWRKAFADMGPNGTILHYCFSEGVTHTRNSLESFPHELRKRIQVVAACPSCYIDRNLCMEIVHLCCENDFVHKLDVKGFEMAKRQGTIKMCADKNAPFFDHDALSNTIKNDVKDSINDFLNGGNQ